MSFPAVAFHSFAESFVWSYAWPVLWQSSLLALIIAFLCGTLFRKASPQFRYMLWLLVIIRVFLPPSLSLPTSVASWGGRLVSFLGFLGTNQPTLPNGSSFVPFAQMDGPAVSSVIFAPANASFLNSESILCLIWLSGAIALTTVLLWKIVRLHHQIRHSNTPAPDWLLSEMRKHAGTLQIRRVPHIIISDTFSSPVVCGFFRPAIVIPHHILRDLNETELAPILLHELAHIRRFDYLVNCFQIIAGILFFFNPILWFVNRQIRIEREKACDDLVLIALGLDRQTYANSLLKVIQQVARPMPFLPGFIGIIEHKTSLGRRLLRILDQSILPTARLRFLSIGFLIVFACLFITFRVGSSDNSPVAQPSHIVVTPEKAHLEQFILPVGETREIRGLTIRLTSTQNGKPNAQERTCTLQVKSSSQSAELTINQGQSQWIEDYEVHVTRIDPDSGGHGRAQISILKSPPDQATPSANQVTRSMHAGQQFSWRNLTLGLQSVSTRADGKELCTIVTKTPTTSTDQDILEHESAVIDTYWIIVDDIRPSENGSGRVTMTIRSKELLRKAKEVLDISQKMRASAEIESKPNATNAEFWKTVSDATGIAIHLSEEILRDNSPSLKVIVPSFAAASPALRKIGNKTILMVPNVSSFIQRTADANGLRWEIRDNNIWISRKVSHDFPGRETMTLAQKLEQPVYLEAKRANSPSFWKYLSEVTGIPITIDEKMEGLAFVPDFNITADSIAFETDEDGKMKAFRVSPLRSLIDSVTKKDRLRWEPRGNGIYITISPKGAANASPQSAPTPSPAVHTAVSKETPVPILPPEADSLYVKYREAGQIRDILIKEFPAQGTDIQVNKSRNALIIPNPELREKARLRLEQDLDKPIKQIHISISVFTIDPKASPKIVDEVRKQLKKGSAVDMAQVESWGILKKLMAPRMAVMDGETSKVTIRAEKKQLSLSISPKVKEDGKISLDNLIVSFSDAGAPERKANLTCEVPPDKPICLGEPFPGEPKSINSSYVDGKPGRAGEYNPSADLSANGFYIVTASVRD